MSDARELYAFACAGVAYGGVDATSAVCVPVGDVLVAPYAAGDGAVDAVGVTVDDVDVLAGVAGSRYVGARKLEPGGQVLAPPGLPGAGFAARLACGPVVAFPRWLARCLFVVCLARPEHYWRESD